MGTQSNLPTRIKEQRRAPIRQMSEQDRAARSSNFALGSATLLQRMQDSSTKPNTGDLLYLQRTIGNNAVSNLLQRNSCDGMQSEQPLGAQGGEVDTTTTQAIQSAKGGGAAVPKGIVADMQKRIGVDVSHARIHTNQHSEVLNRKLNAEAFTHGHDIFFSKDAYRPSTSSGKQLLAHELTHVAQQTGAGTNRIQPKLRIGPANDHFEEQADHVASSVASPGANAPDKVHATGNAMVQRKLKFTSKDLGGRVSGRAKRAGKLGFESTFSKIKRYLELYESAGNDQKLQISLLTKLSRQIDRWVRRSEEKSNYDVNDGIKASSLHKLKKEVVRELTKLKDKADSEAFMKEYVMMGEKSSNYHLLAATDDDIALGKKVHQMEKHNEKLPDSYTDLKISDGMGGEKGITTPKGQWANRRDRYRAEKHLGLSPADRAAINIYTGDQFVWMNPAMAKNEAWFQGTMDKELGPLDGRKSNKKWRKEAMEENRKIGAQLTKALDKLPNWKQTKTIYRGESVTDAEAQSFQVGSVKDYPFFVSTSLSTNVPLAMMKKFTSQERPWGVLYHITASKTGKDVATWSANSGEEEILFPHNTKFRVTKVLMRDAAKKRLDLEVTQS